MLRVYINREPASGPLNKQDWAGCGSPSLGSMLPSSHSHSLTLVMQVSEVQVQTRFSKGSRLEASHWGRFPGEQGGDLLQPAVNCHWAFLSLRSTVQQPANPFATTKKPISAKACQTYKYLGRDWKESRIEPPPGHPRAILSKITKMLPGHPELRRPCRRLHRLRSCRRHHSRRSCRRRSRRSYRSRPCRPAGPSLFKRSEIKYMELIGLSP